MVFFDEFLYFLKIKIFFLRIHQNYLVALKVDKFSWSLHTRLMKGKLKDNLPHNTCQIYVKPHLKNTQMTLQYHIFDEKALE